MRVLPEEDIDHQIDRIVDELTAEFRDVPPDDVRQRVMDTYARFSEAKIKTFVPLFVRRRVRGDLRRPRPGGAAPQGIGQVVVS